MSKNLKKVHWTKDALCKFDKKFTFDRLILQWKRVEDENESIFGEDSVYVSVVMRREREALSP